VNLSVGGISLVRHTDSTGANSAPAGETWVNAKKRAADDPQSG
jgi:hypothetical protein